MEGVIIQRGFAQQPKNIGGKVCIILVASHAVIHITEYYAKMMLKTKLPRLDYVPAQKWSWVTFDVSKKMKMFSWFFCVVFALKEG